ncbi:MAG: sodium:solute symporter family transporter, partial [Phycisphaerae bacterium]
PVILRGLIVASMLAAVMSSLDGMMINFSGMMVNNFYKEYIVKQGSPKHYFRAARAFAVVGVAAGWFVADRVTSLVQFAKLMEPFNSLVGVAILVALVWRRATKWGAVASVVVMFPLYFLVHKDLGSDGLMSLPIGIRHAGQGLIAMYTQLGHEVHMKIVKEAVHLPVEMQVPMYLIPGLVTIIVVSLLTKQHNQKNVDEFYARLDTPVGDEHKLREMGYLEDDLKGLDGEVITVDQRDRDVSKRLLLPDLLRLPKLLIKREAKIWDYKWDLIGLTASIAFVVLFIMFVQWLGSFLA